MPEFWAIYRRGGINPFWPTLAGVLGASALLGILAGALP